MNAELLLGIIEKKSCHGCSACHDKCTHDNIKMKADHEGFLYPYFVDGSSNSCNDCIMVCPVLRTEITYFEPQSFIAWNKNDRLRETSSSGGIFSSLAERVIAENGIVIGAAFDQSFHLRHTIASSRKDFFPMMGSKYLQSDTRGIYRKTLQYLEKGITVLFTGTPCQIGGLYSFLNKSYENLITCDVFCHGVPSPGIFRDYLDYLEAKMRSKIISYEFRSKESGDGWAKSVISVSYANGKIKRNLQRYNHNHSWFGRHLSVRPACFDCTFRGKNREADITIGDFWGIEKYRPDIDRRKGISAVLVNTDKGKKIWNEIKDEIFLESCPIEWVLKKNKYLVKNYPIPADRDVFISDYRVLSMKKLIKKYPATNPLDLGIKKIFRILGFR